MVSCLDWPRFHVSLKSTCKNPLEAYIHIQQKKNSLFLVQIYIFTYDLSLLLDLINFTVYLKMRRRKKINY